MSNDVTLRELMEEKFQSLDKQLADIRESLDYLSQNMVHQKRFDSKMHDVEKLEAMVGTQDKRIVRVEHFQSILKYVGGLAVMILMAVAIAWLTGLI